jgi:hypothetical protein
MKLEVQTKESSMRSKSSKVEEMKSKILPQGRKVNFDSQDVECTNSEKADGFWS